jgi:hypothetical protein
VEEDRRFGADELRIGSRSPSESCSLA